jgi:hypothetical protein
VGLLDLRSFDIRGYGRVTVVGADLGEIAEKSFVKIGLGGSCWLAQVRDTSIKQSLISLELGLVPWILFLTLALAEAWRSQQSVEAPPSSLAQLLLGQSPIVQ